MNFCIFRITEVEGKHDWGWRHDKEGAISYAETLFRLYSPGGEMAREDDPLVSVEVMKQRTGEIVWKKDVEKVGAS